MLAVLWHKCKIIRTVVSDLIISVISEEHESCEKNGPTTDEEKIVCDLVSVGTSIRQVQFLKRASPPRELVQMTEVYSDH